MKLKGILKQYGIAQNLLIVLIAVLLVSNAATIYLLAAKIDNDDVNTITEGNININQAADLTNDEVSELVEQDNKSDQATGDQIIASTNIEVEWSDWPVKVSSWALFSDTFIGDVYKIGTVKSGLYVGKDLYLVTYLPEGPMAEIMVRVIKDDSDVDDIKLIVLGNHSNSYYDRYESYFITNDQLTISNLEPPQAINLPNSAYQLVKSNQEPFRLLASYENPRKMFKYNSEYYIYKDNRTKCFLAAAKDGTVREYYYNLDFLGQTGSLDNYPGTKPYQLDFTWNDGVKNTNEYLIKNITGGCGTSFCYSYVDYITDLSQLTEVGRTASGQIFYQASNVNLKALSGNESSVLEEMYEMYYPGYNSQLNQPADKISFEEFIADRPIIYWQDPFGDFLEFRNAKYLPMVECGKPVIYLYPETATDVYVKVEPAGGLTVTEPLYGDGWKVLAQPSGELYNYSDGQNYPYLFWEGYGLDYQRPAKGFVVGQHEVKSFFEEKLTLLGLVKHEYDEFIDFWQPKMQESEYYFVTFLSQREFDKLAPLTVSPRPDTIIRVFMDYQPLSSPISVEPQQIVTPERKGFTVVEWGGALHR